MSKRSFTLAQIAEMTHSKLVGDPAHLICNVADLSSAGFEDASFLANSQYMGAMRSSKAGALFISPQIEISDQRNYLVHSDPSRAFQQLVEAFIGESMHRHTGFQGIHPTAVVHESAVIGENVSIGPRAVIDQGVLIGARSCIGAGCYIGLDTVLGEECLLYPNVTVRERCRIGQRVILQPGVVIGSCGFGYTTDAKGCHIKLSQVGTVVIEDDVEIGANTTIDRSRFKETLIKRGTKIDNLVMIGHGVTVGEHNLIVAQTGIAGSSCTGKYVVLAGQVAVAGHLSIADRTMIAGKSGVSKSITEPGKYGGIPVMPLAEYNRNSVYLRNIESHFVQLKAQIQELRQRLADAENGKGI
jgi:UDP-3-O-[3-hydroxymyristoyl] glucosamine N-acyltransferase